MLDVCLKLDYLVDRLDEQNDVLQDHIDAMGAMDPEVDGARSPSVPPPLPALRRLRGALIRCLRRRAGY